MEHVLAAAALLFVVFGLTYRHRACAGRSPQGHGGCGSCAAPRKEHDHAAP